MARIDITSIPNAPGLPANPGVMEPTLLDAAPVIQGMNRLRQESMPLDAFSGEAKGMQALGQGVGTLATPLNQYADALSRAKTASDMAKVKGVMLENTEHLKNTIENAPWQDYEKIYNESIPEMQKKLDALDVSPAAKNKQNTEIINYLATTGIMIRSAAEKRKIGEYRGDILNTSQKEINNGNYEGAIQQIHIGEANHLFSKQEAEAHVQKIQEEQKKMGWQQAINADAKGSLEALQADLPTGKSEKFPGANPVELSRLTETARSEVNRLRMDATRDIENLMEAGGITTDEQIKAADPKGIIDEKTYKALQNRLKNVNPDFEQFASIQTEIAQLVPKDPKDPGYSEFMEKAQELRNRVNTSVGSAYRSPFIQELSGKLQRSVSGTPVKPEDGVIVEAKTHINHLFETNTFGAFGKIRDPKTGVVDEAEKQKYEAAWAKKEQFLDLFSAAVKSGKISDHDSATNWINDNLNDAQKKVLGNKLNQPTQGGGGLFNNWINNFKQGMGENPELTPTGVRSKIGNPQPGSTPLPQGAIPAPKGSKVTNYWPTEVKGKDGIVGNHDNPLQPGDFAASPDVEESLKANGVKPGDPVLLHLSDGDTITAKYNDSTAQDSRRKKEGKAPLRGRFDLWTASKGHTKDGVAVVGYSLPNRQS